MAKYIRQASPYNTEIVALGIDTYLKMLLHDNFVVRPLTLSRSVNCVLPAIGSTLIRFSAPQL